MSSLFMYAATALITYIAYSKLFALFQTVVRKAPPVAANSWWTFLKGKSVPGNVLIEEFYEKVRILLFCLAWSLRSEKGVLVSGVRGIGVRRVIILRVMGYMRKWWRWRCV